MEPCSSQYDRNIMIYDKQMLQINELDEWWTHVKEKLKKLDEEPKRCRDQNMNRMNQFKAGNKVLLDKTDPRIAFSELNANGSNSFTIMNVFPYGIVEVTQYEFGTFKVNNTRIKPYLGRNFDSEKQKLGSVNHHDHACIR
ncbi:hypothetical protein GOBAR_DD24199 [Gossypium barbadense]|nr:hypothetical protein GOBAR_DD24199 [Gossypium barbadense]